MNDYEKTLKKIELLEKEWRYNLSDEEDKNHSFGRVPEDGNEVAFWSVPRNTGEFLKFSAELLNAKTVLELGCSAGYSALFLAKAMEHTGGHVYTTEILDAKIKLAKEHFIEAKLNEKITLLEGEIKETLENWNPSKILDLVFVDADKENYAQYMDLLLPLLKKGGLIIADNAGKVAMPDGSFVDCEHIKKFVSDVKYDKRVSSQVLNVDNGLLLIRKR